MQIALCVCVCACVCVCQWTGLHKKFSSNVHETL